MKTRSGLRRSVLLKTTKCNNRNMIIVEKLKIQNYKCFRDAGVKNVMEYKWHRPEM